MFNDVTAPFESTVHVALNPLPLQPSIPEQFADANPPLV
jgi:hypothetical protein